MTRWASLELDPQLESLLGNRKRDLGIGIELGLRLGLELAFNHGIDLGRGRSIGLQSPIFRRLCATALQPLNYYYTSINHCSVWSQKPSEATSKRLRSHARTRPYRPSKNRSRPDRPVPVHYLLN